ncbi:hypothetical protein FRB99_004722, partial [Tulasnella sp. 403]
MGNDDSVQEATVRPQSPENPKRGLPLVVSLPFDRWFAEGQRPLLQALLNRQRSASDVSERSITIIDPKNITITAQKFAIGTFSDVSRGDWRVGRQDVKDVAIKVFRITGMNRNAPEYGSYLEKLNKRIAREMAVWQRLDNPRVTPFLGFIPGDNCIGGDMPCLVSPYRANSTMDTYLINTPDANKLLLLEQAAEGLVYLHTLKPNPIAHLDVKLKNVLINEKGEPELCDFGLSRMIEDVTSNMSNSSSGGDGTIYFTAPEILNGQKGKTTADIYAFAGMILHAMSNRIPFYQYGKGRMMILKSLGEKPRKIDHDIPATETVVTDLWELMNSCWDTELEGRPTADGLQSKHIPQGSLTIVKVIRVDGALPEKKWRHWDCISKSLSREIALRHSSGELLEGYANLRTEDRDRADELFGWKSSAYSAYVTSNGIQYAGLEYRANPSPHQPSNAPLNDTYNEEPYNEEPYNEEPYNEEPYKEEPYKEEPYNEEDDDAELSLLVQPPPATTASRPGFYSAPAPHVPPPTFANGWPGEAPRSTPPSRPPPLP